MVFVGREKPTSPGKEPHQTGYPIAELLHRKLVAAAPGSLRADFLIGFHY